MTGIGQHSRKSRIPEAWRIHLVHGLEFKLRCSDSAPFVPPRRRALLRCRVEVRGSLCSLLDSIKKFLKLNRCKGNGAKVWVGMSGVSGWWLDLEEAALSGRVLGGLGSARHCCLRDSLTIKIPADG